MEKGDRTFSEVLNYSPMLFRALWISFQCFPALFNSCCSFSNLFRLWERVIEPFQGSSIIPQCFSKPTSVLFSSFQQLLLLVKPFHTVGKGVITISGVLNHSPM